MLVAAEKLAKKSGRTTDENQKLHDLIEDARHELQLGEVFAYGTKEDYKPFHVCSMKSKRKRNPENPVKGSLTKSRDH